MYSSTNNESSYEYIRENGIINRLQTRIAAMRDNSQPSSRVSVLHRNYTNRSIVRSYLGSLSAPVAQPSISGIQVLTQPKISPAASQIEPQSCSNNKSLNGTRACPVDALAKERPPSHRHVKKGRGKGIRHRPSAKSMRSSPAPAASFVSVDAAVIADNDASPEAGFSLGPASLSSAEDVLSVDGHTVSITCGGPSAPCLPSAVATVTARSIFTATDTGSLECLRRDRLSLGSAATCSRACSQAEAPTVDVHGAGAGDGSVERSSVPRGLHGFDAGARVDAVCAALAPAAPEYTCAVFAAANTAASPPLPLQPAMLLLRDRQLHVFLVPSRESHAHTLPNADVQARLCADPPSLSLHLCAALVTVDDACAASALIHAPSARAATPATPAGAAHYTTLWPLRVRSQRGPPRALRLAWPSAYERDLWVPRLCACLAFVHAPLDHLPLLPPGLRRVPMGLSDDPAATHPPGVAVHTDAAAAACSTAHLPHVSLLARVLGARLRPLVSKKKRRFVSGTFDLDLTYITSRVLAMGFPACGREAWYRNARPDVQRFLAARHRHYRVYNLCAERVYPMHTFPSTCYFPFDDHAPCSFADLLYLVHDMQQWMCAHPDGVLAVHCKAGKGRTGLAIAALLVYTHTLPRAADALRYYGLRRTRNGKGVTIPSQARWVHMLEVLLARTNDTDAIEAGAAAAAEDASFHGTHNSSHALRHAPCHGPGPIPTPVVPPLRVLRLLQVSMCDAPTIDALLVRCRGEEHVFPLASLSAQGRLSSRAHSRPHTHPPLGTASAAPAALALPTPPPTHTAARDAADGGGHDYDNGYEGADDSSDTDLAVAPAARAWRVPGDGHVQTDLCDGQREVCLHLPWRPLGALCATAREREAWHAAHSKDAPCSCCQAEGDGAISAPDWSSCAVTLAESHKTQQPIRHALEARAGNCHSDESTCGVCVSADIQVEGVRGGKTVWLCWLHTQFVDAAGRRVLLHKCDLDVANKNKALSDFAVELLFSPAI